MIIHIKGIATDAYSGRTNSSVRMSTLLLRLLIASRQLLMDTLQPQSALLYTDQLIPAIRTIMFTQCMLSHGGMPVFGIGVTFGLKGGQMCPGDQMSYTPFRGDKVTLVFFWGEGLRSPLPPKPVHGCVTALGMFLRYSCA